MQRFLKSNYGFSMVEMLVAIAMVGIAIPPLIGAFVQASQASLAARNRATAINAAEWKLASVMAVNSFSDLLTFSESGPFTGDDGAFDAYEYEITATEVGGNLDNYQAVRLEMCVFYQDVSTGNNRTINRSNTENCDLPDVVEYVSRIDFDD